ncbi:MAG: glycoside hydrolase family 2 protein, partial [Planctomycetota bacterium]
MTDLVRVGSNELSIVFRSPITEGLQKYKELDYRLAVGRMDLAEIGEVPGGKRVSVFTRKAGYHFGWDWGPRLVSSGIWRPARLVAWDAARLTDLRIVQRTQSEQVAKLTAEFEIEADGSREASLAIRVDGAPLQEKSVSLKRGVHTYQVDFQIENPELWWCNGLGEPHLYDVAGVLECGSVSSEISHRVGVRTIELVREKDAMGTSFYFKVNGQPVFMKGANYIPCDIYPTRTTTDDYRRLLQSAVDSNFNMLRVWGGGIYENDEFYDLCDELGLLVWQDFMFACNMFPGNDAFLENVREEAIDNVRRLRNHPCLAMWCGNNEILVLQFSDPNGGTRKKHLQKYNDQLWGAYKALFHELLPAVVEAEDPDRFYWPSSPSAGPGIVSRDFGLEHGDEHYWGVWHRKKPYETYSTYIARFMSEYGFQSFPEIRTVEEFALPGDYGLDTEVMNHHQRSRVGNAAIEHYLLQSYNKPKDFEAFLYVGQVLQAELIKYAIEAHRRSRPFCMGTLYWQLNDVWPVASWSSIDHSFRWKALQYFVRKAYAPVLLSPFEKDGVLDVHVVNDSLAASTGVLRLRLMDFGGRTLWEERVDCELPANNAEVAFSISRDELLSGRDAAETLLLAEWESASGELADAVHYFRAVKQLR